MHSRRYSSAQSSTVGRADRQSAAQAAGFTRRPALRLLFQQLLHNARNIFGRNALVHQQLLGCIANRRTLRLGIDHNASAISKSADSSTKMWQFPAPVSITGTVAFSVTKEIRPGPPRGISTSTSPRALISSCTESRVLESSSSIAPFGTQPQPHDLDQVSRLLCTASLPPRRTIALPVLSTSEARINSDIRPRFVDHTHHAQRHAHFANAQAVRSRPLRQGFTDWIGKARPHRARRSPWPRSVRG